MAEIKSESVADIPRNTQGYRFPLELIRKMTPSLAHSTPFRSRRSLPKVSTNSRELHTDCHPFGHRRDHRSCREHQDARWQVPDDRPTPSREAVR
jgi:hypothetical protein